MEGDPSSPRVPNVPVQRRKGTRASHHTVKLECSEDLSKMEFSAPQSSTPSALSVDLECSENFLEEFDDSATDDETQMACAPLSPNLECSEDFSVLSKTPPSCHGACETPPSPLFPSDEKPFSPVGQERTRSKDAKADADIFSTPPSPVSAAHIGGSKEGRKLISLSMKQLKEAFLSRPVPLPKCPQDVQRRSDPPCVGSQQHDAVPDSSEQQKTGTPPLLGSKRDHETAPDACDRDALGKIRRHSSHSPSTSLH